MKRRKNTRLLSLIVLLLVALLVFNRDRLLGVLPRSQGEGDLELKKIQEYSITREPTSVMDDVYIEDDGFAYFEDGKLFVKDQKGEDLWEKDLQGPIIIDKGIDRYLVADKNTGNTYVFSLDGELIGSALAKGELSRAKLLTDNQILLGSRGNRRIMLLNETMKTTADIKVPQGSIINYDVSLDGQYIVCLVLDDTEGELRSSIFVYNFNGELIKMRPLSNFATYATIYKDELFVVYENSIVKYDRNLEELDFDLPLNRVSATNRMGENLFITTGHIDPTRGYGDLEMTNFSLSGSSVISKHKIKENYDNIDVNDSYTAVYTRNMLRIYDNKGVERFYQTYDIPLRKVSLLADGKIALVFPNNVTIYQLH